MKRRWIAPVALIGVVVVAGSALAAWKHASLVEADIAAASQPEAAEAVAVAIAQERQHSRTTTSIGTVVALRSITVRNELPGTVKQVALVPGRIVEAGTVLVALDVSVEEAELRALEAQAELARTQFARMQRMSEQRAASEMEVDTARAERDVSLAQIEKTRAIIARKTIRAPFRARVGIADVHPGQYLNEGTLLTTLQGVDESAYVDFTVAQQVAAALRAGTNVQVLASGAEHATAAEILAIDARVDPVTRNATVRARLHDVTRAPAPGASVRVQVPLGVPTLAVAIPASALRKGPSGDHVFVLEQDEHGDTRARTRLVKVDALSGDEIVVTDGLSVGERVATSGSFKLREAALVVAETPAEAVAANAVKPANVNL
ncbi:MAG TPA: efflux RND transporter periplasmic adaptor subunit [Povalibacter sp.]|uniref:efflux RND transporter periplasmic adaptor subunit n=1 Tax=Povalibacter sp. TaxID=1962978 RepID=UPI002BAD77D9|nr:efflux RND transporter periplasmic adaptor subunit [Povalibacter sp.]HMN44923.1 efflux RND transporter periplasmic adaptor subunit [Povalibacter sp.]